MSIKIYCNDRVRIETAWKEFKRMINANIQDMTIRDDVIKKITGRDREKIRKLERDFDVEIQVNQRKDNLTIKGHTADIINIQGQILKLLKDIQDRENKGKLLETCKISDSAIPLVFFYRCESAQTAFKVQICMGLAIKNFQDKLSFQPENRNKIFH